MAQVVNKGQGFAGQRSPWLGILAAAFIVAAVVIAVAWVAFSASTPKVAAPAKTSVQYLQEPGLLDQRSGERGAVRAQPGGTLLAPGMQELRKDERGVFEAVPSSGNRPTPQMEEQQIRERSVDTSAARPQIHQHRRGHSAGNS
jgi:hypothetical protein